jgi:capsular exopolysaccharide synthesis family protein
LTQFGVEALQPGSELAGENEADAIGVGKSALLPDPRVLWMVFRRRWWVFMLVVAAIMGAVAAYVTLAPRIYSATSAVLIEPLRGDPVKSAEFTEVEKAASSDFIETQILIIDSPTTAVAVVKALDLVNDPEFSGEIDETALAGATPEERAEARVIAASNILQNSVIVRRIGATSLIEIEARARSATQAARIADEYAEQYLLNLANARRASAERASQQINTKLDELRIAAEKADAELQRFKIANGLMSAQGATLAEQESSTLNQQVASAKATLAERQGRLQAARNQLARGGGGSDVASALNSGTIGALRTQEAESSRNLAQLRARYGSKHPAITQEEQRLADIQRQIQLEINRILSSLEAEVSVASSGLSSLLASQRAARSRLEGNTSAQVGFFELERKAAAARTVYEAFLSTSRGTEAREGIEQARASISSNAVVPTAPSSPNAPLAYLLGSVFALTFGVLAIVLVEYLDSGIRTKSDVERRLGARYLGAVPELGSTLGSIRSREAPEDYVISHPQSTFAEALRSIIAAITLRGNRRPKVIAITSALPREGKTTTAVSLARILAMSGAKTVLVDADIRRHAASDVLLRGRQGELTKVLAGAMTTAQALLKDEETDLYILCSSAAPTGGRDLLTPDTVGALLAELKSTFDYVVIDTAPVLGVADARVVASKADAVLLLARWGETSLRAADTALDLLLGSNAKVYGVAMTMVNIKKYASTGHEDVYGYHKQFKGYYVN